MINEVAVVDEQPLVPVIVRDTLYVPVLVHNMAGLSRVLLEGEPDGKVQL